MNDVLEAPAALDLIRERTGSRLSKPRFYRSLADGEIRAFRLGRKWFVPRAALEALLSGESQVQSNK